MKNFKLLLATTAILSAGAIIANAANLSYTDSVELNVEIDLFKATKINILEDDLFLGTLVATGPRDSDSSVRLNPNNNQRTISGGGIAIADDSFNFAQIALNVPTGYKATLTFNDGEDIILSNETQFGRSGIIDNLVFIPEFSNINTWNYGNYTIREYTIGGSIDLSESTFDGFYTGTFTVTAVVEPE